MARVRFIGDYDYKPTRQTTIAYKAGMELTVRRDCAVKAIALRKAVEVDAPKKGEQPVDPSELD